MKTDWLTKILGIDWYSALVGAVLGWAFPKILSVLDELMKRPRLNRAIKKIREIEQKTNAEILSTDKNEFKTDGIDVIDTHRHFYIAFPADRVYDLRDYYSMCQP